MTPDQVTQFARDQQRNWQPVAQRVAKEMAEPQK
jgi:hypothetical protein